MHLLADYVMSGKVLLLGQARAHVERCNSLASRW